MQTRKEVTLPAPVEPGTRPCGCGCGCKSPDPAGCAHDTIVRPRFYCGQLLTDLDMSALVDWARRRLGLSRHRDGWGVVCGLDVRSTPKVASSVTIRPGYAVGSWGDDIVVPHDLELDLAAVGEADRRVCDGLGTAQTLPLLVDVFLTYREEDADPHTAFARACCAETAECENSRTREVFHAYARKAPGNDDPVTTAAAAWRLDYDACLDVIAAYQKTFPQHDPGRAADVRKWLLRWIDKRPARDWCTLRADIEKNTAPSESDVADWLFRLVQEARGAYLTGGCPTCEPEAAVRLARVALRPADDGVWAVEGIDVYPPYRRPLAVDAWPAPLGSVNAAQMLWHRWTEACTRFADLGVNVTGTTKFTVPATVAALKTALTCDPFVPCGTGVVVELYGPQMRVVGLCGGGGTPPPTDEAQPLKLSVSKISTEQFARAEGTISYEVTVRNEDTVEMTVQVQDDDRPGEFTPRTLPPGATSVFSYQTTVPAGATGQVVNKVAVTATAGERKGWADAELSVPVVGLQLSKSGPKTARPGDRVRFEYRVANTGKSIALPSQVEDRTLGMIGRRIIPPGGDWTFQANWVVPDDAEGVLRNDAVATASIDGQQVADDTDYHEIIVVKDTGGQDLLRISGIGEGRAGILRENGIGNLAELAAATPERISKLLGVTANAAQEWIRAAQDAVR